MKEDLHQKNNTRRVLAEPIFSDAGLDFSSTSYTGTRAEPSLRDEPVRSVRNIRVEKSNQNFMHPKKQVSATRLVDFYGRDFLITPSVLIPRPETEMIIDAVLNLVGKPYLPGVKPSKAKLPQNLTILDVGTGSGCIAITLKLELPKADVYAVDVSITALKVARKNAKMHNITNIDMFYSDLMSNATFRPELAKKLMDGFHKYHINATIPDRSKIDVVVANLPYVDKDWDWIDKEALSKEPKIALYANNHGLALIYKLIKQYTERAIPYLVLEADPCQHDDIINYARKRGLELVETRGFVLTLSNPQASH